MHYKREVNKPKAILVLGGSDNTEIIQKIYTSLNNTHPSATLDNPDVKIRPFKRIKHAEMNGNKRLVVAKEEAFYESIQHHPNIIFECEERAKSADIRTKIDALVKCGYEVELHLVDTPEDIAIARAVDNNENNLYAKKSNRNAKKVFQGKRQSKDLLLRMN